MVLKKMTVWSFYLIIIASTLSCSKSRFQKNENGLIEINLRQEWFPYSGYAGEVVAAQNIANKNGLNINIKPGSENVDPIRLVANGDSDFGVISADRVILANLIGTDVVAIGVINYKSPTCFLSKKNSGITEIDDFVGNRVGILTGTNTELIYKMLKTKINGDISKIREKEIAFNLTSFILDDYDVRPAFWHDETISLEKQGIEYNVIKPEDYGINFIGTVYFTTKEVIEKYPEVVQSFINSIAEGWEYALANPEEAIELLKEYDPSIDETRELKSLKKGKEYFMGQYGKVLYADLNLWDEMMQNLISIGEIESTNTKGSVNMEFINQYHKD